MVHGPIYGRFMDSTVNGSLYILMFIHRLPKLDKHRDCCVTSKHEDLYGEKTYSFRNLRKWKDFNKKQLTLPKTCVTSLLCGQWADLWPFYGLFCKLFSLYKKVFIERNPFIFVGYGNDKFCFHTNPYISNITQQFRCSPTLIFRASATCG